MSKQRGRTAPPIRLTLQENPAVWRYASVAEALRAALPLLAEAILSQTCQVSSDDHPAPATPLTSTAHDETGNAADSTP